MSNAAKVVLLVAAAMLIGAVAFASGFAARSAIALLRDGRSEAQPELAAITPVPALPEAVTVEVPVLTPETDPAVQATPEPSASPEPAATQDLPSTGKALAAQQLELVREAWDLVQQDYYGDIPANDALTDGAIQGMIETLDDPYTAYIEPQTADILREDETGTFEGIGAMVQMNDDLLEIVSTFEGQPAEQAGVRAGDIVVQVDDTKIENMSVYEAISYIRGPAGTKVRLKVMREGESEPLEFEITRARIDVPLVKSEMREDGIGYVALYQFDPNATAKLAEAVDGLLQQNPKGLILDLRGNPGGLLNEAVMTPSLFLPNGTPVLIERFKDGTETRYNTEYDPIAGDIPLVVLVDGGSASASEIVAGALQDHGRGVLIGEKTFGKGSVQYVHDLSNGAQLRVTTARWFTPKDRAIHGEGLEPDIAVEITPEDADAGRDPQLERAVQYLLTGK
jgi:carboxyl-terminal processing protease